MSLLILSAALSARKLPNVFELTFGISVSTGLRYVLFAGIAWLLGYVCFKRHWLHRKIIARMPAPGAVWREIGHSLVTLVIFGMVGAATTVAAAKGLTQMYWKIGLHGWTWFWASVVIAIFLHDAYFYWTHRLMHHRRLFRLFHRVHHESTNPTPWASYSFGPLEAVVQAGIFPLTVFLVPIHPLAFTVFMVWQLLFNVAGHTGYEFYPRWLMDTWIGRILNTPTNHIMHHEKMRGNYGLYFNLWDRLVGTNHKDYETRFREVTSRPRASSNVAAAPAAVEVSLPQV